MQRVIFGHGALLVAAALLCAAPLAHAQVDEKCMGKWHDIIAAEAVGEACKVGDTASMAKLKSAEDAALGCAAAKMGQAEATEFRANAAKTKAAMVKQMSGEPCPAQAKAFYQNSASQMAR